MGLPGVDVASYQGLPGQWKGSAGAIQWAAVKLTEYEPGGHSYVNPDALADWEFLKAAGHGRIAYLFGHPSMPVAATVNLFTKTVSAFGGLLPGDGIMLDHETTDGRSAAQVSTWAQDVLQLLKRNLGRTPMVYTYLSFAWEGNCNGLGAYPLWISDPDSPAGRPRVPSPWKTWAIHQYSVTGGIDRDVTTWTTRKTMAAVIGKQATSGEADVKDLGGSFGGDALTSARWDNGVTVVAGTNAKGQIMMNRWASGDWSGWSIVVAGPVKSAPSLTVWPGQGHLYYTAADGHVVQLASTDHGQTWT
jgi:lysozyme